MIKKISKKLIFFFSNGHERSLRAKKNIAISFLLKGFTIVVVFLLVPVTIKYVNPLQYGIWLTISSTIGLISFLDIGLGHGLKNKLAEANALENTVDSKIYISTTYAVVSLIALGTFLLFFMLNFFLDWNQILNVPDYNIDLNSIILIAFGALCIQLVLQLLNSVLISFHATFKASLINSVSQFVCLILIIIVTKFSIGSLFNLVTIFTVTPLLVQLIASIWYYKTSFSIFSPSFKSVNFKYAKDLLSIGGVFLFIQLGALLLFQTDNIVIIKIFGPKEVTEFNIAYKLFSVVNLAFTIVMNPFWSAFTDAYVKKDMDWIESIFKKLYNLWKKLIISTLLLLCISPFLYKIWLNNITIPFGLSFVMSLYVIGICWMMIHCFFLNGIGKIKVQFYLYAISTIINIPLAIYLAKHIGIIGVVISNILILILMSIVLYIQCKKILNNTAKGVWNK